MLHSGTPTDPARNKIGVVDITLDGLVRFALSEQSWHIPSIHRSYWESFRGGLSSAALLSSLGRLTDEKKLIRVTAYYLPDALRLRPRLLSPPSLDGESLRNPQAPEAQREPSSRNHSPVAHFFPAPTVLRGWESRSPEEQQSIQWALSEAERLIQELQNGDVLAMITRTSVVCDIRNTAQKVATVMNQECGFRSPHAHAELFAIAFRRLKDAPLPLPLSVENLKVLKADVLRQLRLRAQLGTTVGVGGFAGSGWPEVLFTVPRPASQIKD